MRSGHLRANPTAAIGVPLNKETPDAVWRATLSDVEYYVLRAKGTEPRGGEYDSFYPTPDEGHFVCRGCAKPLYSTAAKFESRCGWPAFDKCFVGSVECTHGSTVEDDCPGDERIEITCSGCAGHLGHVFVHENMTPTNERHLSLIHI